MGDKKIVWAPGVLATGANTTFKSVVAELVSNSAEVDITVTNVSGFVNIEPATTDGAYYCIVYITDPAGTLPGGTAVFDGMTDATLQTWLDTYRSNVWMTMGGICETGEGESSGRVRTVEFDANTKRTLKRGQKCMLALLVRNQSSVAQNIYYSCDFAAFFA